MKIIKNILNFFIQSFALICLIIVLTNHFIPYSKYLHIGKDSWISKINTLTKTPQITTKNNKIIFENNPPSKQQVKANKDYHWNDKNINVYIDTPDQNYQSMYRYGMKAWNDFGYFHLNEVFHKDQAKIICRLTDKPNTDWIGQTTYVINTSTRSLVKATIELNTHDLKPNELDKGIRVAIHELGHAVGLDKHNKDKNSIMYYEEDANQHLTSEIGRAHV